MKRGIPFESSTPTYNALMYEVGPTFLLLKCSLISISVLNHLYGKLKFSLYLFLNLTFLCEKLKCMIDEKPLILAYDHLISSLISF